MRKALIYIIFFLVSVHNISLYQVWKIPMLVQHFKDHIQRNSKVGVVDFLSMHYWGEDINDDDQAQDMQLPFKDLSNYILQPFLFSQVKIFTIATLSNYNKNDFPLSKDNFFPQICLQSLYRPPQA